MSSIHTKAGSPRQAEDAKSCKIAVNCATPMEEMIKSAHMTTPSAQQVAGSTFNISSDDYQTKSMPSEPKSEMKNTYSLHYERKQHDSIWLVSLTRLLGPIVAACFSSVCIGILLDNVRKWDNFKKIDNLIIVVPVLLGLKANLEGIVNCRLYTAAALNRLDDLRGVISFLRDDLILTQYLAIAVSIKAAILIVAVHAIANSFTLNWSYAIVVSSSAAVTASLSCGLHAVLRTVAMLVSVKLEVDAEDFPAPVAASVGDIATFGLFAYISRFLFEVGFSYTSLGLLLTVVILCEIYGYMTSKSLPDYLFAAWSSITISMCISLGTGYLFYVAAKVFPAMLAHICLVSGIGRKMLVTLNQPLTFILLSSRGYVKASEIVNAIRSDYPFKRASSYPHLNTMFSLLLCLPPVVHFVCLPIISLFIEGISMTIVYAAVFVLLASVHAVSMLLISREVVLRFWGWGIQPDIGSLHILTVVADLTGVVFTFVIFAALDRLQDPSISTYQRTLTSVQQ